VSNAGVDPGPYRKHFLSGTATGEGNVGTESVVSTEEQHWVTDDGNFLQKFETRAFALEMGKAVAVAKLFI